eukprot:m.213285 g.213285  ORF g.213285 m.213285 type:complete len:143 (+) comp18603_c2_seq1:3005-3433(+)
MADIQACTIEEELKQKLRKFRFRKEKTNAAIIMKIDMKGLVVTIEDEMDEVEDIEEVGRELPEFSPRYLAYSFAHDHGDGRMSYPLVFVYYCPPGVKPQQNMIYAGTKPSVVQALEITKVFEIRDVEDMTEEWLHSKIAFYR